MKPRRWWHQFRLFQWLHIKRTQLRIVREQVVGAAPREEGERAVRRGLGRRRTDVAPWTEGHYGLDVNVRHIPGQTDHEIAWRLIARMQGHEGYAHIVEEQDA